MKCYAKRHALSSDAMNAAQLVTKQLDNVQNVADADLWVKAYLTDHGVQVWAAKEKSK